MSSYLDISLEKQIHEGKWEHIVDLNQCDERSFINSRILRDIFRNTEYFDHYASVDEVTLKTARNFAEKISKSQKYFRNMDANNPNYPYKYKKTRQFLVESLWCDFPKFSEIHMQCNNELNLAVSNQNLKSVDKVVRVFDSMVKDVWSAFLDVGIDINPVQWHLIKDFLKPSQKVFDLEVEWFDKVNTELDFINAAKEGYYDNVYVVTNDVTGQNYYLTFESPYEASQFVKYTLSKALEKQNTDIGDLSNGSLISFQYVDTERGNKSIPQYTLEQNTAISYPRDLNLMLKDLEKDLKQIEESKTQNAIIARTLKEATEDLEEKDFDSKLGEIVKDLMNTDSEFDDYSREYEEEIRSQIEELNTLIKLVGENGRIIWNVN